MTINGTKTGSALTIAIKGRLDTSTAPQLDTFISENIDGVTSITFDFTDLSYISSAGLRSLLSTHKKMIGKGEMTVTNVNDIVSEIFEITGFSDILNIV
ncbi:MAG: STAS domain-containing protein [Clostridia bacterium]|nr:STAS domain-containing protein [Clostridia bacterium]